MQSLRLNLVPTITINSKWTCKITLPLLSIWQVRKVLGSFLLISVVISMRLYAEQQDTAQIQEEENLEDSDQSPRPSEWLRSYLRCFVIDTGHIWRDIFTISS